MCSHKDPFERTIEYSPSDKTTMDLELSRANKMLRPHHLLIKVLSTQYQAMQQREPGVTVSLVRMLMRSLSPGAVKKMRSVIAHGAVPSSHVNLTRSSTHCLAREVRFSLLIFGFQVLSTSRMESMLELRFRERLYNTAFAWFGHRPQ